jgi:enoyl-CoA hydratase/carnithine racemase
MGEIITDRSQSILRVELNRPAKKNAMTSRMYVMLADIFNEAAKDDGTSVVLWHGAGDSFCAGNDIEDFLQNSNQVSNKDRERRVQRPSPLGRRQGSA